MFGWAHDKRRHTQRARTEQGVAKPYKPIVFNHKPVRGDPTIRELQARSTQYRKAKITLPAVSILDKVVP